MPSKTTRPKSANNKTNCKTNSKQKKPLDSRAKMFLVLALCCLALLITTAFCLLLISGVIGGKGKPGDGDPLLAESEPLVVESNYDQTQNIINVADYAATILPETPDAGDSYLAETLFLGDSNTARMYRLYDYCSYANAIGSVGMAASSLKDYACVQLGGASYVTMPQAVAQLQPRRVILTFGTNDLNPNRTPETFVENYQSGIEAVQAAYPSVDIIVNAIPPLGQQHSGSSLTQTQVDAYNKALVQMCSDKGWKFINSAEVLKDSATGFAKQGYVESVDGIHLTQAGMAELFQYIRTHAYITDDDRPPLTAVPTHTGDKDVVVYVAPTAAPPQNDAPEETEEPVSSEESISSSDENTIVTDGESPAPTAAPTPGAPSGTTGSTPSPESGVTGGENGEQTADATPTPNPEEEGEEGEEEEEIIITTPTRTETSRSDPTCTEPGYIHYSDGSTGTFGGPLGHIDNDGNGVCDRDGVPLS